MQRARQASGAVSLLAGPSSQPSPGSMRPSPQVSAHVLAPPPASEQDQPASTAHSASQPSPEMAFPSSQGSPPARCPSPHTAAHGPIGVGREVPGTHSQSPGAPVWFTQRSFAPHATAPVAQSSSSAHAKPEPTQPARQAQS